MPFDPTLPLPHSNISSAELRAQFNGLKAFIDSLTTRVVELEAMLLPGPAEMILDSVVPGHAAFYLSGERAVTFNVLYRTISTPAFTLLSSGAVAGYYETPPLPAGDYEFIAQGVNGVGTGPESGTVSATIP